MVEGKEEASTYYHSKAGQREREKGEFPHTFKWSGLLRIHSLSPEQQQWNLLPWSNTSHQASPQTCGDYNLRWDLGGDTEPNHMIVVWINYLRSICLCFANHLTFVSLILLISKFTWCYWHLLYQVMVRVKYNAWESTLQTIFPFRYHYLSNYTY